MTDGVWYRLVSRVAPGTVAIAVLAACSPAPASAQVARHYAGFAVGATYSELTDYLTSLGWRWGGTAGIQTGVAALDYTYLELAANWTRVGGGRVRLDYLDVPVTLGARLPLGASDRLVRLYGGLAVGFRIGCSAGDLAACDVARGTVWSTLFGLSFIKVVPGGHFAGVDARYVLGLSKVFTVTETNQRSWQLRALFGIPLGGP